VTLQSTWLESKGGLSNKERKTKYVSIGIPESRRQLTSGRWRSLYLPPQCKTAPLSGAECRIRPQGRSPNQPLYKLTMAMASWVHNISKRLRGPPRPSPSIIHLGEQRASRHAVRRLRERAEDAQELLR
jgi:hypothetical protein